MRLLGNLVNDLPSVRARADFASDFGHRFHVTIDTEEEFDWGKPFSKEEFGLSHIAHIARFQSFCEDHGVIPLYYIDYPIATSKEAVKVLGPAVASGKADLGIHLHPWVTPPFTEEVNNYNSFAGNLPAELEEAKFATMLAAIAENFGVSPKIYRAGRYGLGPNSSALLRKYGITMDSSVRSACDFSHDDGPNYNRHPLHPYWTDKERSLLEIPVTTTFHGKLRRGGKKIFPLADRVKYLPGALARLGLLEKISITPEGVTIDEAKRGIDAALRDKLPLLTILFHSPSLMAGWTPYVRNKEDLEQFYAWWSAIFQYMDECGIRSTNVAEIWDTVRKD